MLLTDLVYAYAMRPTLVLSHKMVAHHVVCLLGHTYAMYLSPRATRPCFLCAITLLEAGSASANVFHLTLGTSFALLGRLAYLAGMSLANGIAFAVTFRWN